MQRKGIALIGALFVLVVIAGMTLTILTVIIGQTRSANWNIITTRAYFASEAGLEYKISELNNRGLDGSEFDPGIGEIDGSRYNVIVSQWGSDNIDNNNDGFVDEAGEQDICEIISRGFCGRANRTIKATVALDRLKPPDAFAAVHLYNPEDENGDVIAGATVNFDGVRPPNIDGRDTNIPREAEFGDLKVKAVQDDSGEGRDVMGVAAHDDVSVQDLVDGLTRNADRVFGIDALDKASEELEDYFFTPESPVIENDAPSVANIADFDPLDANGIFQLSDYYAGLARKNNVFNDENHPVGNQVFGTLSSPQITIINNNNSEETMIIDGRISGAGILVVSGDVSFQGTVNFAGIIIVTSDGTSSVHFEGTPLIFGSVYAASSAVDLGENATALIMAGTTDLFFSREAMELAQFALPRVELLAVAEVGAETN